MFEIIKKRTLTKEEEEIISSISELGMMPVSEVMIPRVEITAVSADQSIGEIIEIFNEKPYSKFPVYYEDIDNIIGIIFIKEILKIKERKDVLAAHFMKLPYFIPYTKPVLQTLRDFQKMKISIAIVVDEFGGVEGLITTEDLIEEIVGELQDEFDIDQSIERKDDGIIVSGNIEISKIEDFLNIKFNEKGVRTIGGLIMKKMKRIPNVNETFRIGNLFIKVLKSSKQRIYKVFIKKL
jgi:putative hemolysin